MTGSLASDGQTTATGNLKMGNNRVTGMADGIASTDAASLAQVTSAVAITGGTINGTSIGATTASTGRFTTLDATGNTILGGTLAVTGNGSFSSTGALKIPAGTTAEQPTPVTGQIRYNTTNSNFEGYYASAWGSLGSASGSNTQVQYNNSGALAGSSNLTFDGTTLTASALSVTNNLSFNSGYGSSAVAYGCRAWVNFNGTGTPAIRASGNVTSITDNGTGDYTVNFTTAMPDANYVIVATGNIATNNSGRAISAPGSSTNTTTAVGLRCFRTDTLAAEDFANVNVAIFR
jgi:hypothetical protein